MEGVLVELVLPFVTRLVAQLTFSKTLIYADKRAGDRDSANEVR